MPTHYQAGAGMGRDKVKPGDILINTSTFKPAHCGVVVTGLDVIHATGKGIKSDDIDLWGSEADMFRMTPALSDAEAAAVTNIASEIMKSAQYGVGRAMFKSTFSTHDAGKGLFKRLEKYRERLHNEQGVVKNVYCSELVIISYQLACIAGDAINDKDRKFIKLDGKHTWPSTLRRYLKADINWTYLGEYKPQKNQ
jgi:hypothetical protein